MSSDSVNKLLVWTWVFLLLIPFVLFFLATLLSIPISFYLSQISWLLVVANEVLAATGFCFSVYFALKKQSFISTLFLSFGIGLFPFLFWLYVLSSLH
ncbi:MAG: hypothetical protein COZ18_10995 [Flexibacter sp. CG_4_10_14_3_um_filter_32_15]|nr:MAG: hypothetical protein COZ18_10995 [Flexibacter sp. CG_4_10_14_3_um_filter_32_15]